MSFTTYCVCLELRSLPSTGITRLHWYYEPLRHPGRPVCPSRASGWSSLTAPRGFPCFVRFPCVHAVATTPAQRLGVLLRSLHPAVSAFPIWQSGRPAHCPFRGLLGVHSRYGLHTRAVTVFRDTLSEGFSHFVTSIAAPVASGWSDCRVGFAPTGKRRLFTAHATNRQCHSRLFRQSGLPERLTERGGESRCAIHPGKLFAVTKSRLQLQDVRRGRLGLVQSAELHQ